MTKKKPSLLRRFVFHAGAFLLIGAIVNVVVAWAFMVRYESVMRTPDERIDGDHAVWLERYRRTDDDVHHTGLAVAPGVAVETAASPQIWRGSPMWMLIGSRASVGWPLRSLSGGFWHVFEYDEANTKTRAADTHTIDAISIGDTSDGAFLPLRPLWSGFTINTVFYAAILWLLFFTPFVLRRRFRIRRSLCPKCAYPKGISEVCTECGTRLC